MSRPGDWNCKNCKYFNFGWRESCQICGEREKADPSNITGGPVALPGDWYCTASNCGAHNFANRSNCYSCSAMKEGYAGFPGWKVGDWVCTRCNVHNYASRRECFKCNSPRDF